MSCKRGIINISLALYNCEINICSCLYKNLVKHTNIHFIKIMFSGTQRKEKWDKDKTMAEKIK